MTGAASWYGHDYWTSGRFMIETDDAYVQADFAVIAPKVSGYVARVAAAENQPVQAGEPLVILEDGDYRDALALAKAQLAAQEAAVARIGAQAAAADAAVTQARARVDAAAAAFTQTTADLARYGALAASDVATAQRLEAAEAAQSSARASLAEAEAGVTTAEANRNVIAAQKAEAEAMIAGYASSRDKAARDLEATVLRAPFDGAVGNLSVAAGDLVAPGQAAARRGAARLCLRRGELQGDPDRRARPWHRGPHAIRRIAPASGAQFSLLPPENATGNFTKVVQRVPVRIAVPREVAAEGWLRPGLSVVADRRDDRLPRLPGLHRRRDDPARLRRLLHHFPEARPGAGDGARRPHGDARPHHRSDRRRLPDRALLLALALPRQPRARHRRHRRRLDHGRLRQARALAPAPLRLRGARRHGDLPRQPRVRARGGAEERLFEDRGILFSIASALGAIIFFRQVLTRNDPIVDLRAFLDRNFAVGSLLTFVLGIGLYGLTYLYPLFLARVRGYSALHIGETVFVTGAFMFLTAPAVGFLARKLDPRLLIILGLAGFAMSSFDLTRLTGDWAFGEFFLPQALRGASLMLCMIPINVLAPGTLPPERIKNASALFNLTRNLGGAFGLAAINTILTSRTDLHAARLADQVAWGSAVAEERLAGMIASLQPTLMSDAAAGALVRLRGLVMQQATVMAFADVFLLIAVLFGALILLVALVEKPGDAASAPAH